MHVLLLTPLNNIIDFILFSVIKKVLLQQHHFLQLAVLFIKLAERLYDLRHAEGYIYLTEVQHMAQETLAIDVKIANAYLGPGIGAALEEAANDALKFGNGIDIKKNEDS